MTASTSQFHECPETLHHTLRTFQEEVVLEGVERRRLQVRYTVQGIEIREQVIVEGGIMYFVVKVADETVWWGCGQQGSAEECGRVFESVCRALEISEEGLGTSR